MRNIIIIEEFFFPFEIVETLNLSVLFIFFKRTDDWCAKTKSNIFQ